MLLLEKLAGFAGAGLFVLAGAGLLQLLPGPNSLPRFSKLALTFLLGIGWVAGGLYGLSYLFDVPLRRPAVLVLAGTPALVGLLSGAADSRPVRQIPVRCHR